MHFSTLKRIVGSAFITCALIAPGLFSIVLWLRPTMFREMGGMAVAGYFTLAESVGLILLFIPLGQAFAPCLFREFCATESLATEPASFSLRRAADVIHALRGLSGGRGYLWFLLLLALGGLAFYAAALLIGLYLDLGAGTLLLAFIALTVLGSALMIFFGLPCVMQACEMADPAAILAQSSQKLRGGGK